MSTADIVILILLGLGAVRGYRQGFVVEAFSLVAFFLGIIIALHLTIPVTARFFAESSFFEIIAVLVFISLFVLLSVGIKLGGRAIKSALDVTILGSIDSLVGGLTGVLKWAFLVSVVFWILDSVGVGFQQEFVTDSLIFPYIVNVAPQVLEWVGELIPAINNLLDSINEISKSRKPFVTIV